MSKTSSRRIREIEEKLVGRTGHRVLLVEGSDDVDAFSAWLTKAFGADWEGQWVIAEAGKKTRVLEILEEKTEWIGVVDRDEWSSERIGELEESQSNLWVLPRYCIENYLIVPDELWHALPPIQQSKVRGGFEAFEQRLVNDLGRWVKHGALWSVVNPLWEGLRALGFKEALLDPAIVTDDQVIQIKLEEWHSFLNPEQIFERFQQELVSVQTRDAREQLRVHVHGKKFYETVVYAELDTIFSQEKASKRQQKLVNSLPVPDDLQPLWQKMGLKNE